MLSPDAVPTKIPRRIFDGFSLKSARLGEEREFLAAVARPPDGAVLKIACARGRVYGYLAVVDAAAADAWE